MNRPLLYFCAGLIGYRALSKTMNAEHLGLYGFGSAAHILTQVACKQERKVYAVTTPVIVLHKNLTINSERLGQETRTNHHLIH